MIEPRLIRSTLVCLTASFSFASLAAADQKPDTSQVPGHVIDHSPASSGIYIGSPSIAVLPNGDYVASHDEFGPKSAEHKSAITHIFRSTDRGETWDRISTIDGAFWSTLFVHRDELYLIGTTKHHGDFVIRRSTDGGKTWSTPTDERSGLLLKGQYHCAPVPVVEHAGKLWRGVEDAAGGSEWGKRYRAMVVSVPVDADLLDASQWIASNYVARNAEWLDGKFNAWLEGNAVVTPEGGIVDILRVDTKPEGGTAAIVQVSADGKQASFDPEKGFISFPGGAKKFTIRHDKKTNLYWSLANYVPPRHAGPRPASTRNTLALISSPDLKDWTVHSIVLYHPDVQKHAFQYVDWLFEGDDLIVACRTAYDDGLGGAHNAHDANFMTFHRVKGFRDLTMEDSVPAWKAASPD